MPLSDQFSDTPAPQQGKAPLASQFSDQPVAPATTTAPSAAPSGGGRTGIPLIDAISASATQGVRDIVQTFDPVTGWVDKHVPFLRWLDEQTGMTPEAMAAQTQAYTQSPEGNFMAAGIPVSQLSRYGTQMLGASALGLGRVASAIPLAAPTANLLTRAVPLAARGAIMGGGTNLLASGGMGESPGEAALSGGIGGAILGPVTPALGRLFGGGRQALVDAADRLGITLTAGQRAGGIAHQIEDASKLSPFSFAGRAEQRLQGEIGTVLRRESGMGGTGDIDTQQLLQGLRDAGTRINNAVAPANVPVTDAQLWTDLNNVRTNAMAGTGPAGSAQMNYYNNLLSELQGYMRSGGGNLSGRDIQTMIERGRPLDRAMNSSDSAVADVGAGMRQAILDAAERSSPGVRDALAQARYEYKVLKTAQPQIAKYAGGTEMMSNRGFAAAIDKEFAERLATPGSPALPTSGSGSNAMVDLAKVIRGTYPMISSGTAERITRYGGLGALAWAVMHPHEAEDWLTHEGAPIVGGVGALGAAMRFAPRTMLAPMQGLNRLMQQAPAALGPWVGRPFIGAQPPPGAPQQ